MTFAYSDVQWQAIMATAGDNGRKLAREEMEELATVLLINHAAINSVEDRKQREADIAALKVAKAVVGDGELGKLLEGQIERRSWYHGQIASIASARRPKGSREHLIRDALISWFAIGNGIPGRHRQESGPAIRFTEAVVNPVFAAIEGKGGGVLKVSTIQATLEKMFEEQVFEKITLLD